MMSKNVMIPLFLLEQILELLERWDVSGSELQLRCDYHNVLDQLICKKQKINLRDAYAKILAADTQDDRDLARIQYLRQKRLLELDDDPPF